MQQQRSIDTEEQRLQRIYDAAVLSFQPENDLEHTIIRQTDFLRGLDWGVPRYGHPEGKVLLHIREVLDNVDTIPDLNKEMRTKLRIITLVHDTFKYIEDRSRPRNWSKHHAKLARNFLTPFTNDQGVLDVIEWHDEAFYSWRNIFLANQKEKGETRVANLKGLIGDNLQLYYLFFKCDTETGDKIQAPLKWVEETFDIDVIPSLR